MTVASGAIVANAWYLVSGGTLTHDSIAYAVGEVFLGTAVATFSGAGAGANLIVEVGRMFPGDHLGPIRRGAYTPAGVGALYHWVSNSTADLTCPFEVCAAECDDPTA